MLDSRGVVYDDREIGFQEFVQGFNNKTITRLDLSWLLLDGHTILKDLDPLMVWGKIIKKVVSVEEVMMRDSMSMGMTDQLKHLQNGATTSSFIYSNYIGSPFDVCAQFTNLNLLVIEDTYLEYQFTAACGDLQYVKILISNSEKINKMSTTEYALSLFGGTFPKTTILDILSPDTTINMTSLQIDRLAYIFPKLTDLATSVCMRDFFVDATNKETFLEDHYKMILQKDDIRKIVQMIKRKFPMERFEFVFDKSPEQVEKFAFLCDGWSSEFNKTERRLYCKKTLENQESSGHV